jgi:predicted component of type VI protein secretion system
MFRNSTTGTVSVKTRSRRYHLGCSCLISRDIDCCSIVIPNAFVSRHHLTIQQSGSMWTVHVHSNVNWTFLNGNKLTPPEHGYELRGGDVRAHHHSVSVAHHLTARTCSLTGAVSSEPLRFVSSAACPGLSCACALRSTSSARAVYPPRDAPAC